MDHRIVFLIGIFLTVQADEGFKWNYDNGALGPDNWSSQYSACGGKKQSPINFPAVTQMQYKDITPFTLHNFDDPKNYNLTLENNGHSLKLNVEGNVYVTGGGLKRRYNTAQLHLHWGTNDTSGSEHLLFDRSFPMELHVVNWDSQYANISEAAVQPQGLAVLGFWGVTTNADNNRYSSFISSLADVRFQGKTTPINNLVMRDMLPIDMREFFRYSGSLTTPGCYESVIWSVFNDRIIIGKDQVAAFRSVFETKEANSNDAHHIEHNFRPTQPLNDRVVQRNFNLEGSSAVRHIGSYLTAVISVISVAMKYL